MKKKNEKERQSTSSIYFFYYRNYKCSMIFLSICVSLYLQKMLPKVIKIYKRKYLGWLQGENRKLHKISKDKNLMELVHRKISHTMWNFAYHVKFRMVCKILWLSLVVSHGMPNCLSLSPVAAPPLNFCMICEIFA